MITGVRRSGKSCLLKMVENELKSRDIKSENIIFLNFESLELDVGSYEGIPIVHISDFLLGEEFF